MPWPLLAENIGNDDSQGLNHAILWGGEGLPFYRVVDLTVSRSQDVRQ
jgi:hypothetical protein